MQTEYVKQSLQVFEVLFMLYFLATFYTCILLRAKQ